MEYQVCVTSDYQKNRQSSVFYDGCVIYAENKNKTKKLEIYTTGYISCDLISEELREKYAKLQGWDIENVDDHLFRFEGKAVSQMFKDLELTNGDTHEDNFYWHNNNWFVYLVTENDEELGVDDEEILYKMEECFEILNLFLQGKLNTY